ncbi:amidohydrolase family protein [Urechidicola croceus]|uniref:Amidohydrolase n=1 Tax=Urechidicola croceus TaxID=1850246 RepID=A0A1D8P555_9FLAO|nr:amidohydrolase family protein [Urechidicola croceus]AOW19712.1 amidohydrolase [Urechidicola croceus]
MKKLLLCCLILLSFKQVHAQEYFPTNEGVKNLNEKIIAFKNAIIHVSPSQTIDNGVLLIEGTRIIEVAKNLKIPKNSQVIDLKGKHIYPSFIDMYSNFGIEKPKKNISSNSKPQYDASRKGFYWNDHIKTDQRGFTDFKFDSKKSKELLEQGFGVVSTHQQDGIMRGTGMLVALNTENGDETRIISTDATQHLSFNKSVTSKQSYPTSTMGSMALIRQVYNDVEWYQKGLSKTKDLALEALNKSKNLPIIFEANSLDNTLRASKIANEFNLKYTIKGSGYEYEQIDEIINSNANFIIPVKLPKPYDVSNPYAASKISLNDMRKWNQAPTNLKILSENGVEFALTTADLKSTKDFRTNLLKYIEYGFDKQKALEALTTTPAKLLGKNDELGVLKNGAYANFLITSNEIFNKENILYENWVQGTQNVINEMNIKDIRGNYTLNLDGKSYDLKISGELKKLKSEIKLDSIKIASNISYSDDWMYLFYTPINNGESEFVRLSSKITDKNDLSGSGKLTNGKIVKWTAKKRASLDIETKEIKEEKPNLVKPLTYPNVAFGFKEMPKQETILFKNLTVWTNEKNGILKNTDVLIKDGKIAKIGQNLNDSNTKIIDGTGKHLTSGIIDEHSHIATTSVNESGQNSTAEVTIEDVVDYDDIDIYRNLAGGVTTIQILHGSANPIGGRSALIKLKWGNSAKELLFKNRPKFIKFALGENVKQTNWGDSQTVRFPQTRMGVEQLYIDYFNRAKEYDALKKSGKPYRKDIELETLSEILNKERFITCHSYVQSEINMLMKVAEKFNFNINTFTHILEGYKVADKMKKHGVGGSTFSDWWAYKFEVNDAIPYNGVIMHSQGVTVAFNSDDAEMSRRLNQEAAKAVKYGGLSEEEAWKFVTLNPAKLLHIDDKVGSIKVGKDADLVLWSDNPLSIYAKVEKTLIEGVTYFDINRNEQMNQEIQDERNELIQMMLREKNKGMKTQTPTKKEKQYFHCDTL